MAFVHPFEDPDVIAGQGTIGLELLEQVPDLARVIVPIGGGGLVSGVAIAIKSAAPGDRGDRRPGRRAARRCGDRSRRASRSRSDSALTIADGIAVKRPGELTLSLIDRWVDDVVAVEEDEVAEAMVFLLERAKLVVEGAGAVGVAALLSGRLRAAPAGTTVVVLSGGNVDAGLLAEVARRHESQAGRRLVLLASLPDRPGSLARLLALVGELRANLLDVGAHTRGVRPARARDRGAARARDARSGPRRARDRGGARGRLRRAARAAVVQPLAVVARLLDERADDAAALVGLGVPLDAEHEPARRAPRSPRGGRRASRGR